MQDDQIVKEIEPPPPLPPAKPRVVIEYSDLLKDPLSEVTRKERRNLLAMSMIGIAMAKVGLVPTEITTLGIKIEAINHSYLIGLVTLMIGYFIVMFVSYALADFVHWKAACWDAVQKSISKQDRFEAPGAILIIPPSPQSSSNLLEAAKSKRVWVKAAAPISLLRVSVDFALPIIVGITAICILLSSIR